MRLSYAVDEAEGPVVTAKLQRKRLQERTTERPPTRVCCVPSQQLSQRVPVDQPALLQPSLRAEHLKPSPGGPRQVMHGQRNRWVLPACGAVPMQQLPVGYYGATRNTAGPGFPAGTRGCSGFQQAAQVPVHSGSLAADGAPLHRVPGAARITDVTKAVPVYRQPYPRQAPLPPVGLPEQGPDGRAPFHSDHARQAGDRERALLERGREHLEIWIDVPVAQAIMR
nr:uncharacterized protein LOC126516598 [Dermacentor andersoni]